MKILKIFIVLILISTVVWAQEQDSTTENSDNSPLEDVTQEDTVTEADYNEVLLWADPLYIQFERMLPKVAASLGRLDNRISSVAVTDIYFSPDLDKNFQKIAIKKIFGKILEENARLKLIDCAECNQIRSEVSGGVLKITKGFGSQEHRRELAKKLNIEGFMSIAVVEDNRQLSVILSVKDADAGRTVLSDVISGTPLPETTHYNIYIGEMYLTVNLNAQDSTSTSTSNASTATPTTVTEYAIILGIEKEVRFAESWLFNITLMGYYDNNSNSSKGNYESLDTRATFDGAISWEAFAMDNKSASLRFVLGMGQILSSQFNYSLFGKVGAKIVAGDFLTFQAYVIYPLSNPGNMTSAAADGTVSQYTGAMYAAGVGIQF